MGVLRDKQMILYCLGTPPYPGDGVMTGYGGAEGQTDDFEGEYVPNSGE